jgi:hypothetical protein
MVTKLANNYFRYVGKEAKRYQIEEARELLERAGVQP